MEKYKVVSWKDYHGIETFFRVVDQYGEQCGSAFSSKAFQPSATAIVMPVGSRGKALSLTRCRPMSCATWFAR